MKVKLVLPAVAFFFAIVASFSSALTAKEVLTSVDVSLPSVCDDIGSCTVQGNTACKTSLNQSVVRYFGEDEDCGTVAVNGTWDI